LTICGHLPERSSRADVPFGAPLEARGSLNVVSEILRVPDSEDEIVLRDYFGEPGVRSNLSRVRPDGTEVWRATPPGPEPDAWTEIRLEPHAVIARSWGNYFVTLDLETGNELSRRVAGQSEEW